MAENGSAAFVEKMLIKAIEECEADPAKRKRGDADAYRNALKKLRDNDGNPMDAIPKGNRPLPEDYPEKYVAIASKVVW